MLITIFPPALRLPLKHEEAISVDIASPQDSSAYAARTFSACQPFGPFVTSNCTVWPSCRLLKPPAWMAEKCTKTSSPFCRLIKPYPLASLNHFTVPCSMCLYSYFPLLLVTLEGFGKIVQVTSC